MHAHADDILRRRHFLEYSRTGIFFSLARNFIFIYLFFFVCLLKSFRRASIDATGPRPTSTPRPRPTYFISTYLGVISKVKLSLVLFTQTQALARTHANRLTYTYTRTQAHTQIRTHAHTSAYPRALSRLWRGVTDNSKACEQIEKPPRPTNTAWRPLTWVVEKSSIRKLRREQRPIEPRRGRDNPRDDGKF